MKRAYYIFFTHLGRACVSTPETIHCKGMTSVLAGRYNKGFWNIWVELSQTYGKQPFWLAIDLYVDTYTFRSTYGILADAQCEVPNRNFRVSTALLAGSSCVQWFDLWRAWKNMLSLAANMPALTWEWSMTRNLCNRRLGCQSTQEIMAIACICSIS